MARTRILIITSNARMAKGIATALGIEESENRITVADSSDGLESQIVSDNIGLVFVDTGNFDNTIVEACKKTGTRHVLFLDEDEKKSPIPQDKKQLRLSAREWRNAGFYRKVTRSFGRDLLVGSTRKPADTTDKVKDPPKQEKPARPDGKVKAPCPECGSMNLVIPGKPTTLNCINCKRPITINVMVTQRPPAGHRTTSRRPRRRR